MHNVPKDHNRQLAAYKKSIFARALSIASILLVAVQGVAIINLLRGLFSASGSTGLIEIIIIGVCAICLALLLFTRLVNQNELVRHFSPFDESAQSSFATGGQSKRFADGRASDAANADGQLNLDSLASYMQEGLAVLRNGNFVYVNSSLAYLVGAIPDEMLRCRINEFIHPDDLAMLNIKELDAYDANAAPSRMTLRMMTRLGDQRWVICSLHHILWEGENSVLMLVENIGALKQVQRLLEEHEQQARILIERTPLGIAMFDPIGQLKVANTAWYSLWSNVAGVGVRRFNILQDPFLPRADVEKAISQVYNGVESSITALEHTAPWGETRWLNMHFHPMQNAIGQVIGMVMIQQDITDHVRSSRRESELNEQLATMRMDYVHKQEKLAMLIDAMPSSIIYVDESDNIALLNRMAEKSLELSRQRLIGQNIQMLNKLPPVYIDLIHKAVAEHKVMQAGRIPHLTPKGMRYEDVVAYPVDYKKQPGAVLRLDDVTERVQAEQGLGYRHEVLILSSMLDRVMNSSASEWQKFAEGIRGMDPYLNELEEGGKESALSGEDLNAICEEALELAAGDYVVERNFQQTLPKALCDRPKLLLALRVFVSMGLCLAEGGNNGKKPRFIVKTSRHGLYLRLSITCSGPLVSPESAAEIFAPFALPECRKLGLETTKAYFCVTLLHKGKLQCLPLPEGGVQFLCDLHPAL